MTFYHQSKDECNLEAEKSHRRDESEERWIDKFRREATEIDKEMKKLKEEMK